MTKKKRDWVLSKSLIEFGLHIDALYDKVMSEAPKRKPRRGTGGGKRGRPATGLIDALKYDKEVEQLISSGVPPTQAVREVAVHTKKELADQTIKHGVSEEHIWHCRKLIRDLRSGPSQAEIEEAKRHFILDDGQIISDES